MDKVEFERRKSAALAAIGQARGTKQGRGSVDLFVEHHLEELPPAYWEQQLSAAKPDPEAVLGLLVCRSSWGKEDLEYFDFTLPGQVTDYVVSVHFDERGEVDGLSMES